MLARNDPEHLTRIAAHAERVQAELVDHPEESIQQAACSEASSDRRALLAYLAERGGEAPRRWIGFDLGWNLCRVARAVKGTWFARERTAVRLTPAGREAARG